MLFERWTGARVLKRWILPKRDLNYKLKLVSNEDWEKKVLIFLGFSIGENPDKTRLTSSSFSDPSQFVFQDRFNQLFLLTYVVTKTYGCNSNLV